MHFHVGDGYLDEGLPDFEEVVRRVGEMVRTLQARRAVPIARGEHRRRARRAAARRATSRSTWTAWAAILARHLGPLDVAVGTEPGDFLVKECAIHLAEVVTVEDARRPTFVGLDIGLERDVRALRLRTRCSTWCSAARPTRARSGDVTVSGHINEGDDLFAEDLPFPDVVEGDIVAAINVGSYNASMTSEHCLRARRHVRVLHGPDLTDMLGAMSR